jgi:hypothetical protein
MGLSTSDRGSEMSPTGTRCITVRASPPEVFTALREAARRTGFQFLSSDASAGTAVFTSARVMLNFGEKVSVRMVETGPGTVEVTLSSERGPSIGGPSGRHGAGADLMAEALSGLLPTTG